MDCVHTVKTIQQSFVIVTDALFLSCSRCLGFTSYNIYHIYEIYVHFFTHLVNTLNFLRWLTEIQLLN